MISKKYKDKPRGNKIEAGQLKVNLKTLRLNLWYSKLISLIDREIFKQRKQKGSQKSKRHGRQKTNSNRQN